MLALDRLQVSYDKLNHILGIFLFKNEYMPQTGGGISNWLWT